VKKLVMPLDCALNANAKTIYLELVVFFAIAGSWVGVDVAMSRLFFCGPEKMPKNLCVSLLILQSP
jgi:hypothetical protein